MNGKASRKAFLVTPFQFVTAAGLVSKGLAPCTSYNACKAVCRNDANIGADIGRLVSSRHLLAVQTRRSLPLSTRRDGAHMLPPSRVASADSP